MKKASIKSTKSFVSFIFYPFVSHTKTKAEVSTRSKSREQIMAPPSPNYQKHYVSHFRCQNCGMSFRLHQMGQPILSASCDFCYSMVRAGNIVSDIHCIQFSSSAAYRWVIIGSSSTYIFAAESLLR